MQLSHIVTYITLLSVYAYALPQRRAAGAHFFKKATTATVLDNGALDVCFDEAGLGNTDVNYSLTATQTSTFGCFNGGGNHPKAANKETSSSTVSNGATFTPQNGRVQACIDSAPPTAGSFTCPPGQTLGLISVSYSGITLTDTTNGVSTTAPPTSRTFISGA